MSKFLLMCKASIAWKVTSEGKKIIYYWYCLENWNYIDKLQVAVYTIEDEKRKTWSDFIDLLYYKLCNSVNS